MDEPSIFCQECKDDGFDRQFATLNNLGRHKRRNHGSFFCTDCNPHQEFSSSIMLQAHTQSLHRSKHKAQYKDLAKNSVFPGKRKLANADRSDRFSHEAILNKSTPADIPCPFCESSVPQHLKTFSTRTGFISHVEFAHPSDIDESAKPIELNQTHVDATSTIKTYFKSKQNKEYMNMGLEPELSESEDEYDIENVTSLLSLREDCAKHIRDSPFDFVNVARDYTPEKSNRFKLLGRSFDIQFNSKGEAAANLGLGLIIIESLYEYLVDKMRDLHNSAKPFYISFCVDSEDLSHPITSPYLKMTDISVKRFLTYLSLASTSHPLLFLDKSLTISINCFGIETTASNFRKMHFGGRNYRNNFSTLEEYIVRKRGFHAVVPNIVYNNDCLLVSVILGLTMIEKKRLGKPWRGLRMFKKPLECKKLIILVSRLAKKFPLINFNSPQTIDMCPMFQSYLNTDHKVQLKIYTGCTIEEVQFEGEPVRKAENQINLLLLHNHLSLISDPLSFFGVKECPGCLCFYNNRHKVHKNCPNNKKMCYKCGGINCFKYTLKEPPENVLDIRFPTICSDCNGLFAHKPCFLSHKYQTKQCIKMIYCITCGKKMNRIDTGELPHHDCLLTTCTRCNSLNDLSKGERHLCTIQRVGLKDLGITLSWAQKKQINYHNMMCSTKTSITSDATKIGETSQTTNDLSHRYPEIVGPLGIVAYDIETRTCLESKKLYPYALTAIFVCSECAFKDYLYPDKWQYEYKCCGVRKRSYTGAENIKKFIVELFFRKRHKSITAYSFNGAHFDNVFILDVLLSNGLTPKVNMIGRKIMKLTLNGVVLKDLRLYLSGKLANLPSAFDFEHVVTKGHFPFLLSNYVTNDYTSKTWPSIHFYQPHLINSSSEKKELIDYVAMKTESNSEFVFMDECIKYCMQDSLIVMLAVLSLEKATLEESRQNISFINSKSFTLAGLSATYFRHIFMKENSIGLVPQTGYAFDQQSIPGEIYFRYINMKRSLMNKPLIKYNRNNVFGELRVNSYKVDGHTETALYEYHGCFWHASRCCYSNNLSAIHPIYKLPFYQIQYMDRIRTQRIREITNMPVVIINHCKVLDLLKKSLEFKQFYNNQVRLNSLKYHVNIREALYGGRVEPYGVSCRLTPSEISRGVRIKMLDVVSLYPYIQMTSRFPKRLHPEIIDGFELVCNGQNMDISGVQQYFGVFSLFYIPAKNSIFPMVPFRNEGKIVFGNCRKCMIGKLRECNHEDSERGFNCMLNSVDLEQGLLDGGRIGQIYEIYDWGSDKSRTDLFSDMIKHLIKGKIKSKEGSENISGEKKKRIIKAFSSIGIDIDTEGWSSSAALYMYYKILLNSLWGKMAQRPDGHSEIVFAKCFEEIASIMEDGSKEVKYIHEINPTMVSLEIRNISTLQCETPAFYNPFIASLITSYSRRLITTHIRTTGASALYTDTDSIIYKSDPVDNGRDPEISADRLIGGLVSEFPDHVYITKIVMLAPKSYIIQLADENDPTFSKSIIKLKGLSMKLATSKCLSVDLLEKIALGQMDERDGREFYSALKEMTNESYVKAAEEKFNLTGDINIPQPTLKKKNKGFGIDENSSFVKRIRGCSDKRMIQIPVVFRDKLLNPYPDLISEYPSLPFGYIP